MMILGEFGLEGMTIFHHFYLAPLVFLVLFLTECCAVFDSTDCVCIFCIWFLT